MEQMLCDVCGRGALLKATNGGEEDENPHYSCGDPECLLAVQDQYPEWETLLKSDEERGFAKPREIPIVKPLQAIKGGGKGESAPTSTDRAELEAILSQLSYRVATLEPLETEVNNIALFLREHYQDEIRSKQPQHQGSISACVIYYLNKEREHGLVGLVRKIRRILSNG